MIAPWTNIHRTEAALALLSEARTLLLDGDTERARDAANEATAVLADARAHAGTSARHLRRTAEDLGLDGGRILRRVRALAEGRLTRETLWGVRSKDASRASRVALDRAASAARPVNTRPWTRDEASAIAKACGGGFYRVTRIRRSTR